ncbi:MAG TPA: alpha/beta hydrolase [Actinophytocola sp.]|jgi:pimeloyl-ACP methyl ester carboxylesterase|nr:alpha/beta hydrolase [Actinophytocola sp.]
MRTSRFANVLNGRTTRLLGSALLAAFLVLFTMTAAESEPATHHSPKPTIVFEHGAFADASGFAASIADLQKQGYTVYAPANPLRGLNTDADYLRAFLGTIAGPIVLVGHSYGGAVMTNAATGNTNVKALVYVAAFALDEGETVGAATALGGGESQLLPHIIVRPYPGAPPGDADGYIDPAFFRQVFAQDVPARQAAVMAASQRPGTLGSFATPSGVPAWRTIPSWFLVAKNDRVIPPEAQRVMAARAHGHVVEIRSSHVAMVSHPDDVTAIVLAAARGH